MSHFKYSTTGEDGAKRVSRLTAKSREDAERKIREKFPGSKIESIEEIPGTAKKVRTPAPKPAAKPAAALKATVLVKPTPAKKQSKLDKLLFRQDDHCFFCGKKLTKAEASIEHLLPKSGGGTDADGNVVACCVTLNRTLGDMTLKEKVQMILKKSGHFTCPKD